MNGRILPLLLSICFLCPGAGATQTGDGYRLDPDTQITLVDGFDAELLYTVPPSQGSWVAMTFDPKGRIIVSDQDEKGGLSRDATGC